MTTGCSGLFDVALLAVKWERQCESPGYCIETTFFLLSKFECLVSPTGSVPQ